MANFNYLVRFEDENGNVQHGETTGEGDESGFVGQTLNIYKGGAPWDKNFSLSKSKATVRRVGAPASVIINSQTANIRFRF